MLKKVLFLIGFMFVFLTNSFAQTQLDVQKEKQILEQNKNLQKINTTYTGLKNEASSIITRVGNQIKLIIKPVPKLVLMQGLLKSPMIIADNDTSAVKIYKGYLYDESGKIIARLESKEIPLPKYDGSLVKVEGYITYPSIYPISPLLDVNKTADTAIINAPLMDVRKIEVIKKWLNLKGILKLANDIEIRAIYKANLFDETGKLIAKLQSNDIKLSDYDGMMVNIAGYEVPFVPDPPPTDTFPIMMLAVPLVDVKKIDVIQKPIEFKGTIKALTIVDSTNIIGLPYRADLVDDNGKLIAKLQSKTIPLPKYDGLFVYVSGFELPVMILNNDPASVFPSLPLIDVHHIKAIPKWVELEGLLKAIKTTLAPEPPYRADLLDNEGKLIANLISKDIPLSKYDGLKVHVGGYIGGYPDNSTIAVGASAKLVFVEKISIIEPDPPSIVIWKGIAYPTNYSDNDSILAGVAPFVLKSTSGKLIGLLYPNNDDIAVLLKKYAINYIIAVAGPVKPLDNSVLNFEAFVMDVRKVKVLEDLRHILWMSEKPIVVKVGEKVNFNQIGDIKWKALAVDPSILPAWQSADEVISDDVEVALDDNIYVDNDTAKSLVLQKYWDFDGGVLIQEPVPPVILNTNTGTGSSVSGAQTSVYLPEQPMPQPPVYAQRIEYVNYDYMYDSRIINILPNDPIHIYKKPGIYKITLTGCYADENGFVRKIESASRLIQVIAPDIAVDSKKAYN